MHTTRWPATALAAWAAALLFPAASLGQLALVGEAPVDLPSPTLAYDWSELDRQSRLAQCSFGWPPSAPIPQDSSAGGGYALASELPACEPPHLAAACEDCPSWGLSAFFGYDSWRGLPDGGWGNNGLHTGVNSAARLGPFSDWTGIGFQLGGSVGVYNFNGTDYHLDNQDLATIQGFVTGGFFRKANDESPWSGAVVQDWMFTSNYGIFARNPIMAQWRGQVGYALGPWNEVGVWATWLGQGDTKDVTFFGPTRWRPVQQFNVYHHYKWGPGQADSWLWFGVPEHARLAGNGSLGDYLVGALANCPLSDRLLLYALVTYMHPSSSPGPTGARDDAWCFAIGLSFFPGRNARTETVAGQCWMPQLPVANNGYFLVDTNRTY